MYLFQFDGVAYIKKGKNIFTLSFAQIYYAACAFITAGIKSCKVHLET